MPGTLPRTTPSPPTYLLSVPPSLSHVGGCKITPALLEQIIAKNYYCSLPKELLVGRANRR